jgi:peptidoglycan/LPS O-acetylase OafA/YrhL
MIRSGIAVLAGIVTLTITSFAIEAVADPLMMRLFPHALPNRAAISHSLPATFFLFTYTALCVAAGGYVTAWIARRSPVQHALVMGIVQVALTVWAMVSVRNEAPLLNWIGALVLTIPTALCGGLLRARQIGKKEPPQEPAGGTVA